MFTCVIGHRASSLGGYRDHNPARLFVINSLRNVYRAEGSSLVACNLELGVGQWAAEAAREARVPFVAYLTADQGAKMTGPQKEHLRALRLAARAEFPQAGTGPSGAEERDALMLRRTAESGGTLVSVRLPEATIGYTAEAERWAEANGLPVVSLDPSAAPPPYHALAALEELRGKLTPALRDSAAGTADKLAALVARGKLGPAEPRVVARLGEIRALLALLDSLRDRR